MTTRARHKKVLKQAKGYYGAKHYRFRNANQAVLKSLAYAYVGRKDKKSDFRKLWIARINAAARMNGTTYSKLIAGLKKANVSINFYRYLLFYTHFGRIICNFSFHICEHSIYVYSYIQFSFLHL